MSIADRPRSPSGAAPAERLMAEADRFAILVVGGDTHATRQINDCVIKRGHDAAIAFTSDHALGLLESDGADLVVLVLPMAEGAGAEFVRALQGIDERLPIVIIGRDGDVKGPADALDLGAYEYYADPDVNPNQLLSAIGVAVGARKQDEHLRYLRNKDAAEADFDAIIGECEAMQKVRWLVDQICRRTASGTTPAIRITGETGTGKGMLAKVIHYRSIRRNQPFVDINCAAIPGTLMEAELFGHERGAFTDARSARSGLFETANGGTLFLDEIGSMSIDLQAKLLTVIEDKRIRRIGSSRSATVDVQVVAASHPDLRSKVRRGAFREDLFHRLDVLTIRLPPLRDRGPDKLLLAENFIRAMCRQYGITDRAITDSAREAIMRYTWPGNVRELKNQIERILLLENDEEITANHFQFVGNDPDDAPISRRGVRSDYPRQRTSEPPRSKTPTDRPRTSRPSRPKLVLPADGYSLDELEKEAIKIALARNDGNVSKAARFLKISRQKLMYRMKKHGFNEEA